MNVISNPLTIKTLRRDIVKVRSALVWLLLLFSVIGRSTPSLPSLSDVFIISVIYQACLRLFLSMKHIKYIRIGREEISLRNRNRWGNEQKFFQFIRDAMPRRLEEAKCLQFFIRITWNSRILITLSSSRHIRCCIKAFRCVFMISLAHVSITCQRCFRCKGTRRAIKKILEKSINDSAMLAISFLQTVIGENCSLYLLSLNILCALICFVTKVQAKANRKHLQSSERSWINNKVRRYRWKLPSAQLKCNLTSREQWDIKFSSASEKIYTNFGLPVRDTVHRRSTCELA